MNFIIETILSVFNSFKGTNVSLLSVLAYQSFQARFLSSVVKDCTLIRCLGRYVFVHSFEGTGGIDVVKILAAHPWVKTHSGKSPMTSGGATLTSSIPTATETAEMDDDALREVMMRALRDNIEAFKGRGLID